MTASPPQPRPASIVLLIGVVGVFGLFAAGCSRGSSLGDEEAVELLVLDGLDRKKAECIVAALDGTIDLEKVTGVNIDISGAEIALLARTNAGCATLAVSAAGLTGGPGLPDELEGIEFELDVDQRIDELVVGGLDPVIAECLLSAVTATIDPSGAVDDLAFLSEAVAICERNRAP